MTLIADYSKILENTFFFVLKKIYFSSFYSDYKNLFSLFILQMFLPTNSFLRMHLRCTLYIPARQFIDSKQTVVLWQLVAANGTKTFQNYISKS